MAKLREEQAARTRARIIAAADHLFALYGYEQTSLQNIADAVGVQKANVYYYFRTKADIRDATLVKAVDNIRKLLMEAAKLPAGAERVVFVVEGYIELLVTHRHRKPWTKLEPLSRGERIARGTIEQLTDRAAIVVFGERLTPLQRIYVTQLLALQSAVQELPELTDDDLRTVLQRACLGLRALLEE